MTMRDYRGDGIVVHWDSDRCCHSERCTRGLPAVFDRAARPWVNLEGALADDVAAVIDTCPSGALSYTRTDGAAVEAVESVVTITPLTNGPLSVVGPVAIVQPDGTTKVSARWTLCRCGHSGSKPTCDGSHSRVGFIAPGAPGPSD
jgi:uncharacterized Fe-S cluster protein YjdI